MNGDIHPGIALFFMSIAAIISAVLANAITNREWERELVRRELGAFVVVDESVRFRFYQDIGISE